MAGRWDRFSWYGIRRINRAGGLHAVSSPKRQIESLEAIATLEALLIRVTTPSLNRRRESLPDAEFVTQDNEQARIGIRGQITGLERKIDELTATVRDLRSTVRSPNEK